MQSRLDLGVKNANKMTPYLDDFFGKAKKVNENE